MITVFPRMCLNITNKLKCVTLAEKKFFLINFALQGFQIYFAIFSEAMLLFLNYDL